MPENQIIRQRFQTLAHVVNSHRLLFYSLASVTALVAVVVNALKNYSNFYSVAIYLSKSSRSVLALANFGFLIALLCGHLVQRLFFGPLRANEVERLYDRLWFFITESLLAFTIFRDEFDTSFAFMFGFLLFVKSFHWLASDRIEWMDQRPYPGPPLLFHVRMILLFALLWATDFVMFVFTIEHTLTVGVGGMVLFASEYGILLASVMNTISKYLLSAYELRRAGQRGGENAPPWENKSMWTFYIELVTDFMKLSVYLVFFTIILTFYGLPLNIVRDVYITARSFVSRLRALHRYQTATRNMDQRYPNANEEELAAMSDRTCIICREEMVFQATQPNEREGPNVTPKKLPCGHIFHFYCLRSWLERQQSCPTCRRTVLEDTPPPNNAAAAAPVGAARFNANPQGNNQFLGNPMGFINGLFAPQNAPQNNNVPLPNPQVANQPLAANAANAAGEGGGPVLIRYEVQYHGPEHSGVNHQPSPHSPNPTPTLQPVPRFTGHIGPNGLWQPWPVHGDLNLQQPATPTEQTRPVTSQDPRLAGANREAGESDSETDSSDNEQRIPTLSPREAARAAALRRLNSASNTTLETSTIHQTPNVPAQASTSARRAPDPLSNGATASQQRSPFPSLIPIHDLSAATDPYAMPPSSSLVRSNHNQTLFGQGFNPYGPQSAGSLYQPPSALQSAISESRPLSSIPSHVSEEQLSRLDRLTREAIDERLRVLEGVSNTVYRCIDDLMLLRSALPVSDNISQQSPNEVEHKDPAGLSPRSQEKQAVRPASDSSEGT
ncbi:hypothetical protein FA15DRAFT_668368 [Coprinopsis marcescibilis]|uniref:RING-type E3 ubiquitin transferase n=1 Tax=Coprinopsis marcescibilis TaxID=230819 RepID=A0A5C3KYL1_COPMA|nr:hypothetical protein FA15DRAFT_668368 [Coprinopsis marcescibilis]